MQIEFWENYPPQKRLKMYLLTHPLVTFRQYREFVKNRNQIDQKILELSMHLQAWSA